jgi:hypothetical protein
MTPATRPPVGALSRASPSARLGRDARGS